MTLCDICGADTFPMGRTRETGAHCLAHAVGDPGMVARVMAERRPAPDAMGCGYQDGNSRFCKLAQFHGGRHSTI